ncbi:MAG: flagellar protein export ATPase FliI [Pseudomonadota bacterium]
MRALIEDIASQTTTQLNGRVAAISGSMVEVCGPVFAFSIGMRLSARLDTALDGEPQALPLEIVALRDDRAMCMAYEGVEGLRRGALVDVVASGNTLRPGEDWLGRIVDGLGAPIDNFGVLQNGGSACPVRAKPPAPAVRGRVGQPVDLGVKAINTFTTMCEGQRMGIFAGSGVGKSVLMSMLARNADFDVVVIGLIGERGREVKEFIEDDLGTEGLKRACVVVATSDEPALKRRQAAYTAMTIAESFRNRGKRVLLMMDSVTRFAMAQREIGLAAGEPPTTKGYTPSVFAELPKLLERAGPGAHDVGSITALFTVLVEGDNHNEPVADAVRGILDGHIVMDRAIAERGRYPAIDVLKSVSRTMPNCVPMDVRPLLTKARHLMSTYADMEDLIRLGAYRKGSDPAVDTSIELNPAFEAFLTQQKGEAMGLAESYEALAQIVATASPGSDADTPSDTSRTEVAAAS